jgi:hypothetical protein
MPTFVVSAEWRGWDVIEIEADSEAEALELAEEMDFPDVTRDVDVVYTAQEK